MADQNRRAGRSRRPPRYSGHHYRPFNTEEFLRVKLGIGRPPPGLPTENYVLSHFPAEDAENVTQLIERAAQAVATLLGEGLAAAQTRFHGEPAE